jgi:hypothetical protein
MHVLFLVTRRQECERGCGHDSEYGRKPQIPNGMKVLSKLDNYCTIDIIISSLEGLKCNDQHLPPMTIPVNISVII